jgi:Ca-activated chloride channel family protein
LYLLLLVPLLIALYVYSNIRRRRRIRAYGDPALLAPLMPTVSTVRMNAKFWLALAALVCLVFVIARPQFGSKMETVKRQGVETVIALDISNSMLAEDVTPSRLAKSKKLISRLVETFNNDKVGLVVFAGDAFTQLPITTDYVSAKMFLSSINPSLIATQGTDIGAAIRLAIKSFTPAEGVGRAIVVITDGENHEGGAVEAAKEAAEKGMNVYVLGVGGAPRAPHPRRRRLRARGQLEQCREGAERRDCQTGQERRGEPGVHRVRRAVPGVGLDGAHPAGGRDAPAGTQEPVVQECENL